ncbi:MAG: phosphoribosylglycinamide formyltransferase [Calditrichaeota bacterium]|nr:MAG: phosphoribosylglycinamide formyltransferase [Calditrichota bacterium]
MKNIAVFATGRGTNFKSLLQAERQGLFSGNIALCIAGREGIGAADIAAAHAVPVRVADHRHFDHPDAYTRHIEHILAEFNIEFILLAGWLRAIPASLIAKYPNKIINIHPALLPFFGGKGMYGMHVHRAVWQSGMLVSGVTIHFVDELYDHGTIIAQEAVALQPTDTPEKIAERVLEVEHHLYPATLKRLLEVPYRIEKNRVIFEQENR